MAKSWYAVYTAARAEKKVAERFVESGVEHYLPLRTEIRIWSDRKKKVILPVISGYIFVFIESDEFLKIRNIPGVAFFLYEQGKPAPIPDKQIALLKFMVDCSDEPVGFSHEHFEPGESVIISRGPLKGLVGEMVKVLGFYKVIIRIENLGCAMTTVPVSFIEKICNEIII